jgi:hypothetical protein
VKEKSQSAKLNQRKYLPKLVTSNLISLHALVSPVIRTPTGYILTPTQLLAPIEWLNLHHMKSKEKNKVNQFYTRWQVFSSIMNSGIS